MLVSFMSMVKNFDKDFQTVPFCKQQTVLKRNFFNAKSIHLTTISVELGFLWDFVRLSLKTCTLYHEKIFIQVVNDISTQVFNNFFSTSDIMEAVRGRLCFYRYECKVA